MSWIIETLKVLSEEETRRRDDIRKTTRARSTRRISARLQDRVVSGHQPRPRRDPVIPRGFGAA